MESHSQSDNHNDYEADSPRVMGQSEHSQTAGESPGSTKPIIIPDEESVDKHRSLGATSRDTGGETEPDVIEYDREDLQHLFTTLYCYSNLLEAIMEDNSSDHFRFVQFVKQVEHKQLELIRVSEALPDCNNLAIDLAYNFIVAASYMNLMFTWESAGKNSVREEVSEIALGSARHMLHFAHSYQSSIKPNIVEEMVVEMQKFCLMTVVEQASNMPDLTGTQKNVLSKLEQLLLKLQSKSNESVSSIHSDEFDFSSSDEEHPQCVKQAIDEAKQFGQQAYLAAVNGMVDVPKVQESLEQMNLNNNADDRDAGAVFSDTTEDMESAQASAEPSPEPPSTKKPTDMDDLILFTNCNPFANVWKLYTDNIDLVSHFKITKQIRQECIDTIPECFKVLLCLEDMAHSIAEQCYSNENLVVNEYFQVLQYIVASWYQPCKAEFDRDCIVQEILTEYSDVEAKLKEVFEDCETRITAAIDELNSDTEVSDCESSD